MKAVLGIGGVALALSAGCGSESLVGSGTHPDDARNGDTRLVVPEGLSNTLAPGEEAIGMTLLAFTLVEGARGAELYAAIRNDRATPVCEGGMRTDYLDKSGHMVSSSASVLLSRQLYALADGTILACVPPGEITMTASTQLPADIVIEELGYLRHTFPAFSVEGLTPIEGLSVSPIEQVEQATGSVYRGTLRNGLAVPLNAPKITVFPVNRVGRPLGVATSTGTLELPPGGTWPFETGPVSDPGENFVVFPSAKIVSE